MRKNLIDNVGVVINQSVCLQCFFGIGSRLWCLQQSRARRARRGGLIGRQLVGRLRSWSASRCIGQVLRLPSRVCRTNRCRKSSSHSQTFWTCRLLGGCSSRLCRCRVSSLTHFSSSSVSYRRVVLFGIAFLRWPLCFEVFG